MSSPVFGEMLPKSPAEKAKAIEGALKGIQKDLNLKFVRLGDKSDLLYPILPTGIFGVDHEVLGIGGFPRGRVVEIFGPEASGKTTLLLQLIAAAQARGGLAAFVDAEHALDPSYAKQLGVNTDDLLVAQPDYGEQACQATIDLVNSGALDLIVVDSVAALVPKAELDGEMEDAQMGLQARMMAKFCRKVTASANKTGTIVCMINQIREKIGVMFGSPETTTGGRALRFAASVRIDIRRIAQVKEGDLNAGNKTKIKAAKNKMAIPFRTTEEELMFGKGIDKIGSLTDYAIQNGVFVQKGAQYTYTNGGDEFKGRNSVRQFLEEDEKVRAAVFAETLKAMGKSDAYIKHVQG